MTLADLVAPLQVVEQSGDLTVDVTGVAEDSRRVKQGEVFVAVKGKRMDGHDFSHEALAAGASALVVQRSLPMGLQTAVPLIRVRDTKQVLGLLASRFHGNPSARLRMVGVTGTNGKTTILYLCKAILEASGRRVGAIGTINYLIGEERLPAPHTTPGAADLQGLLARMVEAGLGSVVMEVSSHALALDRVAGCEFDVALYTNLTQDHLDFHHTMEDYFRAKLRLFTDLTQFGSKGSRKRAIVNTDDPRGHRVCGASSVPVWTYAVERQSDIRAEDIHLSLTGTRFIAVTPSGQFPVESRLIGQHNVYNILAAIGVGLHEGAPLASIQAGLRKLVNVPGRFERIEAGQDFTVIVDYAHTEDALARLLTAAQALKTGRIITVFGCGGDRDRGKRPKMGRAAAERSDVVILTSDNPRTEDPTAILREVEVGVRQALDPAQTKYEMIPDRGQAIESAMREAKAGDMVLIAGKGHEDYQILGTNRIHFDDREVARQAIHKVCS